MSLRDWSTTATENNANPPNGAPEGMAPSAVNNTMRQMMADLRAGFEDLPWFDYGDTPTRIDDNTITVSTDLTDRYSAGRWIKMVGTELGNEVRYALINSSTYSAPDTTINLDNTNVPTGLSNISLDTPGPFKQNSLETDISGVTVTSYYKEGGHSTRYGANYQGTEDATSNLQAMLDLGRAAGFYSSPWSGQGGAYPVMEVDPGRYKLTDELVMGTGCTLKGAGAPAHTTSHTRLIMDSTAVDPPSGTGDNRNKAILKFNRATLNNAALMNDVMTSSIEDLEFWYVTCGISAFDTPLAGTGIPFEDYPDSGTILFDVDAADFRIRNCVFQHAPAAIRIRDVPNSSTTRGDGWTGSRGVGVFVENCEFDAGAAHIFATDSHLDLHFKNCQFFGGRHVYRNCTGSVVYENCRFHGGAWIDATESNNEFDWFLVSGSWELPSSNDGIGIANANVVDVDVTMTGASGTSGVVLTDCNGGRIRATIQGSGYNASAGTGLDDFIAAIKLRGCHDVQIIPTITDGTSGGTFNGFGVLTGDSSGRSSLRNYVSGGLVAAPYNGANFNGQGRYINLAAGDLRGINFNHQVATDTQSVGPLYQAARVTGIRVVPTYGTTITIDSSLGNEFAIVVTNTTAFTISNPSNAFASSGQRITIQVMNFSGGSMGTITWGAQYKMSAWTNPANNFTRAIDFQWDAGGAWREVSRTPADVPN